MSLSSVAYGVEANVINKTNVIEDINLSKTTKSEENIYTPTTNGYYYWQVDSKTIIGTVYGAWENGPEGRGPATLTMAETRTAINSITGTFTSIGDISAALGVSIDVSISHYAGYSVGNS